LTFFFTVYGYCPPKFQSSAELIHITNQKSSRAARDLTRKSELGGYWIVSIFQENIFI